MIKTEQQRWFVFCLIVSLLIHLGIVLALTDIFRPWKSADRLPVQLTVLSVEFKILHLAKKDAQSLPLSPPSKVGSTSVRSKSQPASAPISADHVNPSQRQVITPRAEKSANPPPPSGLSQTRSNQGIKRYASSRPRIGRA